MGCLFKDYSSRNRFCCYSNNGKSYTHLKECPTSESVFHVNKGSFPNNIRSLHMTRQTSLIVITKRSDDVTNRVRTAVVCLFIVSVLALFAALTVLKVQAYKEEQHLLLEQENKSTADGTYRLVGEPVPVVNEETVKSTTLNKTKGNLKVISRDRQSSHNGLYCTEVCRQYSAFRFRSSCVQNKCTCKGQGYQAQSCLPEFRSCAITRHQESSFASAIFHKENQALYKCNHRVKGNSEIHVISNYGNNHKGKTRVEITDERTNRSDITLVLANYQKVKWDIRVNRGVRLDKIYLISNKNLRRSEVDINLADNQTDTEVVRLFSHVGYGEDKHGGHTLELLQTVYDLIGDITSFVGTAYASEWRLNLQSIDS